MMTRLFPTTVLTLAISIAAPAQVPLTPGTVVVFASPETASQILRAPDDYTANLTSLDRQARLGLANDVSNEVYLDALAADVFPWSPEEQQMMTAVVERAGARLAPLNLDFPPVVTLIKAGGRVEISRHTRHEAIILMVEDLWMPPELLEGSIIHEMFHILTRRRPELRDALYAVLGFQPCGTIEVPPEIAPLLLTNPDAPRLWTRLLVSHDSAQTWVAPLVWGGRPYSSGPVTAYLSVGFLEVEASGEAWVPVRRDGRSSVLDLSELAGFWEQVGENSDYVIHPEETLADNFELLVTGEKDVPSPEILARLGELLRAQAERPVENSEAQGTYLSPVVSSSSAP